MRTLFLAFLLGFEALADGRLVAASPQITEVLFQLGLGRFVVGAPAGSHYPPAAANLPSIGQLFTPSLEKVVSLRPDWVVLDAHNLNPAFASALHALGIRTFRWTTWSARELLEDAERFLVETGLPADRTGLEHWKKCRAALSAQSPSTHPTFVGFVWMDPPIVLGPGAFLSRLLEDAGWRNAVSNRFHAPYLPVTEEWLLMQKVDRVFYLHHASESQAAVQAKLKHWWPRGAASHSLDADVFARASFTPFEHLSSIPSPHPLPGACRAL